MMFKRRLRDLFRLRTQHRIPAGATDVRVCTCGQISYRLGEARYIGPHKDTCPEIRNGLD